MTLTVGSPEFHAYCHRQAIRQISRLTPRTYRMQRIIDFHADCIAAIEKGDQR